MVASKVAAGRKHGHPYAITLLLVALCAFGQYEGRHVFGQRAPLGLLYLPVMASAILGGWRPALLASVLSLLLSPLLVAPQFTFIIARPQDVGAILVLLMVCLFTCGMAAVLERSENKARAYLADLQGREHTLRALLGASVHAILGIGHDGRIQFASDSVARLFDFAPQELIGQSYEVLVVNGLRQLRGGGLDNLFHGGAVGPVGDIQEIECRRKDGSLFPAEASLALADVPGGRLVVSHIADISERREAERRVLHAARHDPLTGLPNRPWSTSWARSCWPRPSATATASPSCSSTSTASSRSTTPMGTRSATGCCSRWASA